MVFKRGVGEEPKEELNGICNIDIILETHVILFLDKFNCLVSKYKLLLYISGLLYNLKSCWDAIINGALCDLPGHFTSPLLTCQTNSCLLRITQSYH